MITRFLSLALLGVAVASAAPLQLPTHAEIKAAYLALDTTHNGAIGLDEWRRASIALFNAMDKNDSGRIESTELGTYALIREAFPSVAAGRSGQLTKKEFLQLRETIFHAADISHDDYITFVEYELLVLLRRTGWTDRNLDGRIGMPELRAGLEQAFTLSDADHDGVLTGDELRFLAPDHRVAMDPGKTGSITLEQLLNGYRFLLGADQENRNSVPRAVPLAH